MRVGALYAVLRLETAQFDAALGKSQTKMQAFMGIARATALAAGSIFAAALAGSLYAAQSFEKHMAESLAIMGDVTESQRARMEEAARSVAKMSTFSANEAADAFFYLAGAGYDAEQSIAALPIVTQFAQAGVMDLEQATELLMNAQTSMNLKSSDAQQNMRNMARVSDVLTAAQIESTATLEQMSEALINKAAPALRLVNKPIEEGAAALMVMANQGVKGRAAGTGLAIVLRELQTKALKNADAWKEHNVAAYDAEGNMRNLADIIGDLEGELDGMSDAQQRAILGELGFTDRSMGFIQAMLGQSDAMRKYEEQLRKAGGTTEEVATKQLDTFNAQLTIAWHKIVDVAISIGQKLLPGARDMVEAIGNWVEKNHELIENLVLGIVGAINNVVLPAIGRFIGIVGEIIKALQPVFFWIGEIIFVLTHLDAYVGKDGPFGMLADILMPIITAFEEVVYWIGAIIRNFGDLEGFSGDDSPLGMMGDLVVALGDAMNWIAENVLPVVVEGFNVFVNEVIPALIEAVMWIIENVWPALAAAMAVIVDEVLPRLIDAFNWVAENLFPAVGAAIMWIVENVVPALAAIFKFVVDWVVDNMPLISAIIGQVMGAVSTAFQVAWEIIKFIWTNFGQHIWKGATMVAQVAMPLIGGAVSALLEIIKFVFFAIGGIWQATADAAKIIGKAIGSAFRWLGDFFSGLWDGITGTFRGAINFIIDLINGFIGFLNNIHIDIPKVTIPGLDVTVGGGSIDPFNISKIPHLARGIRGFSGGLALVGENGPELAYLPPGSNVYSNSESSQFLNGEMTVTVRDPDGAIARGGYSQDQIERILEQSLREMVTGTRKRSLRQGIG